MLENEILKKELGGSFCNIVLSVLFLHNLVMCLASGMSIRFIPIFFKDLMLFNPFVVQVIMCLALLAAACFVGVLTRVAGRIGNVATMVIFDYSGVFLFFIMIFI